MCGAAPAEGAPKIQFEQTVYDFGKTSQVETVSGVFKFKNAGAIINLAPDVSPFTAALQVDEATVRTVLNSWGPGKFDAAPPPAAGLKLPIRFL